MKAIQRSVMADLQQLAAELPGVTLEEIAKHNQPNDAWVLIDGIVYDVSKFHKLHPGGSLVMLRQAGKDASADFHMVHGYHVLEKDMYKKLRVARLAVESLAPAQQKAFLAARMKERWVPLSEPYFADPRGTLKSPYYQEKHLRWRNHIRSWMDEHVRPNVSKWDEQGSYPAELHVKAHAAGIFAPNFPPELGGTPPPGGWDLFMDLIHLYEINAGSSGGVMASWFFTMSIALPMVIAHAKPAVRERVARPVIAGTAIIALAVTEPWGGSDVANLRTTAVKDGDFYVVNGEKKFITSGMTADFFTTAVRTDPSKPGAAGMSVLVIDAKSAGITRTKIKTMGWWAGNTAYITFENVRVPKENLIGEEGKGFLYVMENFNHERFAACVFAASGMHRMIRECIIYARGRKTFGKALIDNQVIRQKIAMMSMKAEAHFALCEQIAYMMEHKVPDADIAPRIALCKVNGTLASEFCAREAAQIFGGNSYAREGAGQRIERAYREVRVGAIGGGSEEILLDFATRASKL